MITDTLLSIYATLIGWTFFGLLCLRSLPRSVATWLGKGIYWVGVPLRIFVFTLKADLDWGLVWVPTIVIAGLAGGAALTWVAGRRLEQEERSNFWLSALFTNTSSIGLTITPYLIDDQFLGWAVLFTLCNNLMGSYGLGVIIASYFSSKEEKISWQKHLQAVLSSPALWAFTIGTIFKSWGILDFAQETIGWVAQAVAPLSLLLLGIRLQQVQIKSNVLPMVPAIIIKMIGMPLITAALATIVGIHGDDRLALVLQSGMPTAFAGLVLAETYQLQTIGIVISIVLTSLVLLVTIPCWVWLFG